MLMNAAYSNEAFTPETMLPEQYFPGNRTALQQPEKRLMLAVLEDAVMSVLQHAGDASPRSRRLVRDVEHWVARHDIMWPFSFENICAILDINAEALRAGLRQVQYRAEYTERRQVVPFRPKRRMAARRHRVSAPRPHRRRAAVTPERARIPVAATRASETLA